MPGGTHAPHHPTPEWIKKISDMHLFDDGWNKLRESIFANQKRLGIMPPNAQLTPWPKDLPEWDSLGLLEKKLFIKQADVFGAYLAYTDHEIGRVIAPHTLNGIKQRPMDGVGMAYTWDKASANAPSRRTTQYFEMLGNRAIYHDGWVAATTPATLPWELSSKPAPDVITGYKWELYNVMEDPTEYNDLAAKMPEKLKQMQDIFYAEAKKYDVLPLDNTSLQRWNAPKPNLTGGRTVFTYSGVLTGVPNSGAPNILNRSYTITAEVTIPEGGAEGMIVTDGGRFGGYGLFLSKGELGFGRCKPVFLYNLLDLKRTVWEGPELNAGKHTIVFDFKSDGPGLGKGGTGVLSVDGQEVARNSMEHTTPITFPEDETFDIGQDTRTGVAMIEYRYDVPFKFTGKINKLTFNLGPQQVTAEEREQMQKTVARARD